MTQIWGGRTSLVTMRSSQVPGHRNIPCGLSFQDFVLFCLNNALVLSDHWCSDWFQADAWGFFISLWLFLNQGFKKNPKPNTFHLIKICNENRSLHTQQEKGFFPGVYHWARKFISQNFMGTDITNLPLQLPGWASILGSIYGACISLLCTFGGHRGAERKISPQIVHTGSTNLFVFALPTLLAFTPMFSVSPTCQHSSSESAGNFPEVPFASPPALALTNRSMEQNRTIPCESSSSAPNWLQVQEVLGLNTQHQVCSV